MKQRKKILATLLVCAMVVVMGATGCGKQAEKKDSSKGGGKRDDVVIALSSDMTTFNYGL